jgi:hypothetical protein
VIRWSLAVRSLALAVFAVLIVLIAPGLSSVGPVASHPGCQVGADGARVCTNLGAAQTSGVVPLPEPVIWVGAAILWLSVAVIVLREHDRPLSDRVPYL